METHPHPFIALCIFFIGIYQLVRITQLIALNSPKRGMQKALLAGLIVTIFGFIIYEYKIARIFYKIGSEVKTDSNYLRFRYWNDSLLKSMSVFSGIVLVEIVLSFEIEDSQKKNLFSSFLLFYNIIRWIVLAIIDFKWDSQFEKYLIMDVFLSAEALVLGGVFLLLFFKAFSIKKSLDVQIIPESYFFDKLFKLIFQIAVKFSILLTVDFMTRVFLLVAALNPESTTMSLAYDIYSGANILYHGYMFEIIKSTIFIEDVSAYKIILNPGGENNNKNSTRAKFFQFKFDEVESNIESEIFI